MTKKNKTMKTLKKYLLLLGLFFNLVSCSDFLDEKPQTSIEKEGIYNSLELAKAALSGCYSMMAARNYCGFKYFLVLNTTSGVGVCTPTINKPFTSMNIPPTNVHIANVYNAIYETIRVTNDIIQGMQNSTLIGNERDRILGEAYFIRALCYFNLVRLYGNLPIITEPATSYNDTQKPRSNVKDVYESVILPDFGKAFELLPEPSKKIEGHPHKLAAKAYLAKVYQTLAGNDDASPYWEEAYNAAKEVYDAHIYKLIRPYSNVFGEENNNNEESIFEIQFSGNVNKGCMTQTTFPPGHELLPNIVSRGGLWWQTLPTQRAFDQFDEGDPRREVTFIYGQYRNIFENDPKKKNVCLYPTTKTESQILGLFHVVQSEYPAWKKYVSPSMTTAFTNTNFVFCRYSDIVLVLAEAANELGLTMEAAGYLNEVLDRARDKDGNGVIDPATEIYPLPVSAEEVGDKLALRERIFRERLKEFSGECDEWYTIRRRGIENLKRIMEEHNNTIDAWYGKQGITELPENVYKYDSSDDNVKKNLLLPFPSDEINRNVNIEVDDQNFGY